MGPTYTPEDGPREQVAAIQLCWDLQTDHAVSSSDLLFNRITALPSGNILLVESHEIANIAGPCLGGLIMNMT